ncbi:AAA family ATPase [Paenibacillus rhizoplanae]|uniref:AAA family ATPase n=1 Tax=Paenibacillus rhizoplanae TaxID=1917181 RepID=A0ABW5FAG5_9BACL
MIKTIKLKEIATYDSTGVTLEGFKRINFIFGNNGSGKTTLSEFIRNSGHFPSCSIEWVDGNEMTTCVYNRNFISENFLSDSIKGIFTLGKESVELQTEIAILKETIIKHKEDIKKKITIFEEKERARIVIIDEFREACWRIKSSIDSDFKELIEGFRNSKEKFMQKCLDESSKNLSTPLKTLNEILSIKEDLFNRTVELVEEPTMFEFNMDIEYDPIYSY